MILSAVWNLVFAVGIGLILASLMFMKKIGDLTAEPSSAEPLTRSKAWPDERNLPKEIKDKIFIKHIRGPLFFGSTSYFQELVKQIPEETSCVFIRMDRMQYIDQSGLFAMEDVLTELTEKNKNILFTGLGDQPRSMMETIGIIPILVPTERVFKTFKKGIDWMENNFDNDKK
jgi:SulP family sulfate permease